jgi:hypothetical protein
MDLSFFIVLAVAQAQSPFVSPEPTFGLTNAYGWIGYRYYGRSSDGRFLIRNGGDAPYHHFNNLPYSIDCTTGVVARLDLTQQGELPSAFVGGGTWDTAIIAMSGDTRFLVFLSTSASYADAPSTPDPTALYWLDRDSDEDSIFDEIDGRRVVCIIPEPGFQPPDYSDSDFGDISDDGRHFTYFVNSTGPHRADIWITDLDADENGILAEPGTIAKYPISGSTDDGQFYTPSVRPTISGDGRYVAFEKWAEPAFVNIRVGAGYIFVYDYPPGHPFTRRPMLFDRDSDEDGRYDELGATELRDLGPDVGYSEYSSWTQTVVSGSGREVLSIVSRANMGVYGHSLGRTLVAFDIRSGTSTSLAPSHAYGVDSNPIQFVVDQDARRVFTTTVTSSTPLLPYAPYDNWFISIDRDTDSDGVFDEPESSRTTTLTLPNYQVAWVPVLDPSGHHLRVTLYDTPAHPSDPLHMYGPAHIDFDCGAAVHTEAAMCPIESWKQLRLDVFGCPQAGKTILLELGAPPTAAPFVFLFAGTGTPAPVPFCTLGIGTIDFAFALPFPIAQFGTDRRATLPVKLPAQLPPIDIDLRAVTVDAATYEPWLSQRIHISTP